MAVTGAEMKDIVAKAREAQRSYAKTTFDQRRALLSTILDWVVEHQAEIGAMASRDSGKTSNAYHIHPIFATLAYVHATISH